MEEYIEKNQLKEKLRLLFKYESFPIADIEEIIDWLPVIPKHGRWIDKDGNFECSHCGNLELLMSKYCRRCGARMDERGEDGD